MTTTKASRHRSEGLTSKSSGALCHSCLANIEEKKLTSARADEAQDIANIKREELTSARADEAQLTSAFLLQADESIDDTTDAYTDNITSAMNTTYLNHIHSTYCITLLHLHWLWPIHPECLSHFRLQLHFLLYSFHSYLYKTELYIPLVKVCDHYKHIITLHTVMGNIDYQKFIFHHFDCQNYTVRCVRRTSMNLRVFDFQSIDITLEQLFRQLNNILYNKFIFQIFDYTHFVFNMLDHIDFIVLVFTAHAWWVAIRVRYIPL